MFQAASKSKTMKLNPQQQAAVEYLGGALFVLAGAGSDFHRPGDYGGGILGACPALPDRCRPVWHAFRTPYGG